MRTSAYQSVRSTSFSKKYIDFLFCISKQLNPLDSLGNPPIIWAILDMRDYPLSTQAK